MRERARGRMKIVMSRGFHLRLLFAAIAASLAAAAVCPPAGAQEGVPAAGDSAIYRVDAARLRWTTEDAERVIYLEGGVRLEHQTTTITGSWGKHYPSRRYLMLHDSVRVVDGTTVMTADEGEYFGGTNTVVLRGRVRVRDTGWQARCDRVTYDRTTRVAVMTGNLSLADSTRTLYADTIVYDRFRETADARGGVVLADDVEDYSIAGAHARYDRARRKAVVDVDPVLTFDLRAEEKGIVTSRLMRFDIDRKLGIAEGDVNLAKGETRASCDSAAIYDEEGRIELYGKPLATSDRSSMSGTRMILWYDDAAVQRIVLPEDGRIAESPPEGSPWRDDSWIEGDSIAVYLSDERVDSVRIERSARAMYYPAEETERKVSNNYAAGSRMYFAFREGELSYLRIDGKATGLYQFLNLGGTETIDSLSAAIDTALVFRSFEKSSERVRYSADTIEYYAGRENIVMHGKAMLKYQDSSLEARRIDYDSRLNIIEATGAPVLTEADQRMYGEDMGYDMDTQAGVVVEGSTKYDQGYYVGSNIFKVGSDVLKVYHSTYTTCDLKEPHYSLRSDKMKVYVNDKIVSGPITLRIGELPVFYLPFMVNSLRRDRSSGLLRPNFDIGIDSRDGRFIRGLGYYWATNDYTDFTLVGDFNENRNIRFNVANRYKLRYVLDGDVRLDFVRQFDPSGTEWRIESDHSQQFSRTASFRSNLEFVSSDEAQEAINSSEDTRRFIDRKIYSTASYRQSWGGTSLSLSASRDQKLNVQSPTTPSIAMTLPSLSIALPRTSLWFGDKHSSSERSFWESALGGIAFTPSLSGNHSRSESEVQKRSVVTASSGAGFSRQQSVGFLDVNPSMSLRWNYQKEIENTVDTAGTGIVFVPARAEYRNEVSMSLSTGLGTKIYGTFHPRIGSLAGIRHTLNPVVSWQYVPKLSERQRSSQSVSWELRNSIDLKLVKGERETKQNGVFTWYLNGYYRPEKAIADAFSDISSSMRLQAGSFISFNLNQTWSMEYREIVATTFSTGFDLRGAFAYPATWKEPERERIAAALDEPSDAPVPGGAAAPGLTPASAGSWSLRLNYNLSQNVGRRLLSDGSIAATRQTDSNLDLGGALSLTKNWRITYYAYYNVEARDFTEYRYAIERDLHCWRASFNHRRFGDDWSYYFQIAIKAHPDIMYEQGTRGIQSFGGSGGGFPMSGY